MNTIIFLDIDGVLKDPKHDIWYPDAIRNIVDYCHINHIDIVISSTWRLIKNKAFFNKILNNTVIGVTRDLSHLYPEHTRYYECVDYAKRYKVNNYMFIDDKFIEFINFKNLLLINPSVGITSQDILKLDCQLKKQSLFEQLSMFNDIEEIILQDTLFH